MKVLETKICEGLPISLVSNSPGTRFNVSIVHKHAGNENMWYHFPNMVKEKEARKVYGAYQE
jgi:hypothetical protein